MAEKNLVQKLAEVAAEVGYVQKDAKNTGQNYKYASAEAVLKKINAALSSRNIAVGTRTEVISEGLTPKGNQTLVTVKLSVTFYDGDGDSTGPVTVEGLGSGADSGDKAVMKALTAAQKYAYATAFQISWGDDPEADASTDKAAKETKGSSKRAAKGARDREAYTISSIVAELNALADDADAATLNDIKTRLVKLRGEDGYEEAVALFKSKRGDK